jgi:transposase-like protein
MKASEENPYPKTFEEFLEWFQSEEDCRRYLEWIRWPDGFICPRCGSDEFWRTDRKLIHCKTCSHQTSVTAGTVFEDTRKPLLLWFHVIWLMMAQKTGLSARNLCDTYGFGSYQTAWAWLHKLRSSMIRTGREQLSGRVEVDETYVGGHRIGKRGRGAEGKVLVLVAIEGTSAQLGRVRFRCVERADETNILAFVLDYVLPGATVVTDGLPSYNKLTNMGYDHHPHVMAGGKESSRKELDHVHLVISLLKRWLIGTHQGAIKPEHLQSYLDEFAFRFNRRLSIHRGKLFHRLMQQSVTLRPQNVKDLYTPKPQDVGGT